MKVSLFRSAWDGHLALGDDIDMGSVDPNDYVPIGNLYYPFTGCLDGRGHTIHNFTCRTPEALQSGLFGLLGHRVAWRAPEGLIENVRIRGGAVSGGNRVSLLAGESWGMIRNCHVEGAVTATDSYVGGLIGFSGGCLEDCSSSGQVTGREAVGGLVGRIGLGKANVIDSCRSSCTVTGQKAVGGLAGAAAGRIRDSYATGDVKGVTNVGGLIGDSAARVRACYATGNVEGEKHVGGLVGLNCGTVVASYSTGKVVGLEAFGGAIGSQNVLLVSDMRAGDGLLCFWDQQASGVAVSDGGLGKTTAQLRQAATFKGWGLDDVWVLDEGQDYPRLAWQRLPGKAIRDDPNRYAGGVGTPDDPFQIRTVAPLCAISNYPGDFDAHFVLTQDLDFADLDGHAFVPIGMRRFPFTGSFDGQGHTISHLTIAEPNENYIGLFSNVGLTPFEIENSTTRIADLHLRDVHVEGCEQVGGLAGMIGRATVANCTVTGRVRAEGPVGGLIGWSYGDIARCQANVEVKGEGHVGGLVGQNHGDVKESAAVGYVSGGRRVGGLIGLNATEETGSMDEDCGSRAGGRVVRSFADCAVTGQEEVGGLVGYSGGCSRIESCYVRGTVTGQKEVGGLIGACIRSFIADSYAAAAISAEDTFGSFCGANLDRKYTAHDRYDPGKVSSCFWDVDVAGPSSGFGDSPDPNELHGLPTARMQTAAPYIDAGWDFDVVWTIREGQDYPRLRWEEP